MAVEIGSIDRITAVLGLRGVGKSTFAVADTLEFNREVGGAYMIGHSPGARLPMKLPDGRVSPITWHDDISSLEKGLRRNTDRMHILVTGEPEEVIDFGRRLSLSLRRTAVRQAGHKFKENRPIPDGVKAPPIIILVDEGTAMREQMTREEKRQWKIFLTGARHEHIALTWLIQSPTAKNWILMEQSNRIVTFRYVHEWGLNAIRAAGVDKDDLTSIRELPDFEHFEFEFEGERLADKRVGKGDGDD